MGGRLRHITWLAGLNLPMRPLSVVSGRLRHIRFHMSAMSASKDHTLQSDIGKMTLEADGSFKRAASSFRNWIQSKDGQFPAEKGNAVSSSSNPGGDFEV